MFTLNNLLDILNALFFSHSYYDGDILFFNLLFTKIQNITNG